MGETKSFGRPSFTSGKAWSKSIPIGSATEGRVGAAIASKPPKTFGMGPRARAQTQSLDVVDGGVLAMLVPLHKKSYPAEEPLLKSAASKRWNRCSPASRRTESLPAT